MSLPGGPPRGRTPEPSGAAMSASRGGILIGVAVVVGILIFSVLNRGGGPSASTPTDTVPATSAVTVPATNADGTPATAAEGTSDSPDEDGVDDMPEVQVAGRCRRESSQRRGQSRPQGSRDSAPHEFPVRRVEEM